MALTPRPAATGSEETFIGRLPGTAIDPEIAGSWRHFKGGVYEFVARVEADGDETVLYRDSDGKSWLRPLWMVGESVERGGPPRPRFVRLTR